MNYRTSRSSRNFAGAVLACVMLALSVGVEAETYTHHYDTSGRLTHIDTPTQTIIYTYDAAGNRTSVAVQTKGVDVAIALDVHNVGTQPIDTDLTYTATATNVGSLTASVLQVIFESDGSAPVMATAGNWSCVGVGPVTCTLASLAAGERSEVIFHALPSAAGQLVSSVSVTSGAVDARPANDTASITTFVAVGIVEDTDGDGMSDAWELANGLNPNDPADADLHSDGDNLTNLAEHDQQTDPNNADTDGDGLNDDVDPAPRFDPAWIVPILGPLLD